MSTCTVVTLSKWEWFSDWKDKPVKKRGDDYNYVKDRIANRLWEQCLTLYPQLRDKVRIHLIVLHVLVKFMLSTEATEAHFLIKESTSIHAKPPQNLESSSAHRF